LADRLKEQAAACGFELVGIAAAGPSETHHEYERWLERGMHGEMGYLARSSALRADVRSLLPTAQSVVAVGAVYSPRALEQGPKIARYALGRDYHKVVRSRLRRLATWLYEEAGAESRVCVDSAPVLEREWGKRAGLGWYGKNTCLIHSRKGSWFVIGLLLTSAKLRPDPPAEGGCGRCRACVDACPTGAIVHTDGRWQVDARACISYLTIETRGPFSPEEARSIGDWTFGCDVCQEACPFNSPRPSQPERAAEPSIADFAPRGHWPTVSELASIGEEQWDALTRGSAVRRAGLDGLRRNAAANLENAQETNE
jgi:epoxyqueuosine reductase